MIGEAGIPATISGTTFNPDQAVAPQRSFVHALEYGDEREWIATPFARMSNH